MNDVPLWNSQSGIGSILGFSNLGYWLPLESPAARTLGSLIEDNPSLTTKHTVIRKIPPAPIYFFLIVGLRVETHRNQSGFVLSTEPAVRHYTVVVFEHSGQLIVLRDSQDINLVVGPDFSMTSDLVRSTARECDEVVDRGKRTHVILNVGPIVEHSDRLSVDGLARHLNDLQTQFSPNHLW